MNPIIKKYFLNFYAILGILFFVWLLFIDQHDVFTVLSQKERNRNINEQITFFNKKIIEVKENYHALKDNPKERERFSREKYKMKKETEDVFNIYWKK